MNEDYSKLKASVSFLEQEHAEMIETIAQLRGLVDALTLRLTELLKIERPAPQITFDPKLTLPASQITVQAPQVSVAAPQINLPAADKGGTWEINVPGVNGAPARTVTMKRTA